MRKLATIICQQIWQCRRNGQILTKVQPSKTEPGRNRKYEETKYKYWNWNGDLKTLIYSIYGKDIASEIIEINYEYEVVLMREFLIRDKFF